MRIKRAVIGFTMLALLSAASIAPTQATILSTQGYLQATERQANLDVIDRAMLRDDVQGQLTALGVDPADAMQRIAILPDQDLAALAEQIDSLPAGGDSLFAVVGIVFVVLIILELTGVTNIFTNF